MGDVIDIRGQLSAKSGTEKLRAAIRESYLASFRAHAGYTDAEMERKVDLLADTAAKMWEVPPVPNPDGVIDENTANTVCYHIRMHCIQVLASDWNRIMGDAP